jgi:hypothetical protein
MWGQPPRLSAERSFVAEHMPPGVTGYFDCIANEPATIYSYKTSL